MDGELLLFANTAGTTAVALLATDFSGKVKAGLGKLWDLVHPGAHHIEEELEHTRAELMSARAAGDTALEQALISEWQNRMRRLLLSDPGVAAPLRQLLDQCAPLLAQERGTRAHASHTGPVVQTGGGIANTGVMMGDVTIEATGP